eukprot:3295403-Pyramimonas_sp.AAC.1
MLSLNSLRFRKMLAQASADSLAGGASPRHAATRVAWSAGPPASAASRNAAFSSHRWPTSRL